LKDTKPQQTDRVAVLVLILFQRISWLLAPAVLIAASGRKSTEETQMKEQSPQRITQIDLAKLRNDLQTIMDEIDSTPDGVPDAYSPHMWMRLQKTTEKVATAINAVRLRLAGKSCAEIAAELGIGKRQVAAYVAWNTMLQPNWISPAAKRASEKSFEDYAVPQNAIQ